MGREWQPDYDRASEALQKGKLAEMDRPYLPLGTHSFTLDAVIVFYSKADADRVIEVLPKRFGRFALSLHPEKTRLIKFTRPTPGNDKTGRSGSLDFLGFTHYWAKSRNGSWVVRRKTSKDRFTRALKRIGWWCRTNRHLPVEEQHRVLALKLRGHAQYYYVRGNSSAVGRFYHEVRGIWRKWLNRRSQRSRMNWERFTRLRKTYPFPTPRLASS